MKVTTLMKLSRSWMTGGTKTITTLACAALLAVATTSMAQPLTNGGFEIGAPGDAPTNWVMNLSGGTGTNTTAYAQAGIQSLLIDSTGAAGWSSPNVYQQFPAAAGEEFDFKGYMLRSAPITDASFGLLKIEFKNAGGTILTPASASIGGINFSFPGIESTPFLNTANVAVNTWLFTEAKGIAPVGTASVQFYLLNVNQGVAPGPMYFDSIVATKTLVAPLAASITSPANLADVGADYTISASAFVAPGGVTNVDFYVDNALVGNRDTAPYTNLVTGAADGPHTLKVVAKGTNNVGASLLAVTSSVVNITVSSTATVYVNPAKNWVGYMNSFETPANGSGYYQGSVWATVDLVAIFSGPVLTLTPNSINDSNSIWYVTTNSPSIGNKMMEANMYVEPVGSIPGKTVTFKGTCITNTMADNGIFVGPVNPAGYGWTCVAFIKDLAPDYSSSVIASVPVTNGQPFSVSLATINDPTRHVQYGFTTFGPCVWPQDPVLPSYGKVQIATTVFSVKASLSGATLNLSFPTQTGFSYTVQYKNNLTDLTWTTLGSPIAGTGSTVTATDTHTLAKRFYRVSIQ